MPAPEGGEALILELVRRMVAEVHPHASPTEVRLSASFDELGIGSLELVELLGRVEDAFGVTLPSEVLSLAQNPGDLLGAVSHGSAAVPEVRPAPAGGGTGAAVAPVSASTLVEALEWHATATPGRVHVRLLDDTGAAGEVTYGGLHDRARSVAAGLAERGAGPGDTVAIMLPTSAGYFATFAGALLAGAAPVPIYPPARPAGIEEHLRRHARILSNARASVLVTVPEALRIAGALRANTETLRHVVVPEALDGDRGEVLPRARPSGVALVQYTSGSTGNPKGVVLSHENLLANIRAMGRAAAASGADTFVSWLPLYHDMGLIGAWLSSLYFGMPLAVMAPQVFLTRPARWLWAVHSQGGTISAGPNFAYELCVNRIPDEEIEGLDLSSWRLAFNGAEAVSAATLERFAERFGPYGLRREALTPVYGLAEAGLGVTFPPLGRGPVVDRVGRAALTGAGRAEPAGPAEANPVRIVACGTPLPGYEVRVVDPAGRETGDRREGRIEFRGPSATAGYYRDPAATRALRHGDWWDTGDLGYVAGGDLYVTGRVKDVIVRAGRNLHPEELEEAIGDLPGVRKGCVAVFAAAGGEAGGERLVVVAETRPAPEPAAAGRLRAVIVSRTVELLGAPPDEVVLAAPHTLLKTSSGKLRRTASRRLYETGQLGARRAPVWWQLVRVRASGTATSLRRARGDAAAMAFAAYAWGVSALAAAGVAVALAVVPTESARRQVARSALRLVARLTATEVTASGLDRIPAGRCVVVANHASWLDGPLLVMVLPPSFRFVGGEVLRRSTPSGFVLRRLGVVFVERTDREQGTRDTDRLARAARGGERLVMFPEGALARAPGLRPFHMGAFVVASAAGAPVVPLAIRGTRSMLRPGHRFIRRGTVEVALGAPLAPEGTDWRAAVALQRRARDAVLALSGEPDVE